MIEKPHRANAAGYGDSGPGPTVGFVPTGHGNNFDHAIDVAVNAGEEDKFSFEGFSDSFPFGRRKPHHSPPPPSFKRDLKRPSTQKKRLNGLKSEKNEPVYSGGGKAKFPPAPEFKTPAFKDYETPTGYSVFKQSSFKDDYDGLPFSLDSFKDDYNGPEFRAAGGQFEDYDAADVGDLADFLPPPQSPMVFEKELSSKFPVRDNAPLIKARQPPPPPPPGPPPPPPLPYPKMNKHGALDLAEMGK